MRDLHLHTHEHKHTHTSPNTHTQSYIQQNNHHLSTPKTFFCQTHHQLLKHFLQNARVNASVWASVCVCVCVCVCIDYGAVYFLTGTVSQTNYWLQFLPANLSVVLHSLNNTHHQHHRHPSSSLSLSFSLWLWYFPAKPPPHLPSVNPPQPPSLPPLISNPLLLLLLSSDGFFSQPSGTGAAAGEIGREAERLCWTDAGSERSVASDNHRGATERHRKETHTETGRERENTTQNERKERERQGREVNMWQDVVSLSLQNIGIQAYFEHDLNAPSLQVCLSSVRWRGGGKTRQTAGTAAAAAAAAAVPVELTDALVFSAACRRIVFLFTAEPAPRQNLSQLVGQDLNPSSILSLCAGRLPSRMRLSAGGSGPVGAFTSKQWTFRRDCETGKFCCLFCYFLPDVLLYSPGQQPL